MGGGLLLSRTPHRLTPLALVHDRAGDDEERPRQGKFVLLEHRGARVLCLADRSRAAFHADIVERYCAGQQIAVTRLDDRSPAIPDPVLQVQGGGHFELDPRARTLRLHGRSIAYGPFARAGLRDMLLASGQLPGYTIRVDPD